MTMAISVRRATANDVPLLATCNRHLIEDEGSRNPMTVAELEERLQAWMSGAWEVVVFQDGNPVVGYAVFQVRPDEFEPAIPSVYVRQLFIVRERRRCGLGRRAFEEMVKSVFPMEARISLEVLSSNPTGRRFWESLRFTTYCSTLVRTPDLCQQPPNP
jgi:ribosomal protein S18 acetylase RimI-like enzyme